MLLISKLKFVIKEAKGKKKKKHYRNVRIGCLEGEGDKRKRTKKVTLVSFIILVFR